jgi:hypothetical protein
MSRVNSAEGGQKKVGQVELSCCGCCEAFALLNSREGEVGGELGGEEGLLYGAVYYDINFPCCTLRV